MKKLLVAALLTCPALAQAGNYATCLLDKLPGVQNQAATSAAVQMCLSDYPSAWNTVPQGDGRGLFASYRSGSECTLDKSKDTRFAPAAQLISSACHRLYNKPAQAAPQVFIDQNGQKRKLVPFDGEITPKTASSEVEEYARSMADVGNEHFQRELPKDGVTQSARAYAQGSGVVYETTLRIPQDTTQTELYAWLGQIRLGIIHDACTTLEKTGLQNRGLHLQFRYQDTSGKILDEFSVNQSMCAATANDDGLSKNTDNPAEHYHRIYTAHPDANEIFDSPNFKAWVKQDVQREKLLNDGTTDQVIALFAEYKRLSRQPPTGTVAEPVNHNAPYCEFKQTMTDAEYAACGIEPPKR